MNTLSQFYVQQYIFPNKLIVEKYPGERNALFEFIYDLQERHTTTALKPS